MQEYAVLVLLVVVHNSFFLTNLTLSSLSIKILTLPCHSLEVMCRNHGGI